MGRPKKSHYRRSTPVIRLRRNIFNLNKNADLVLKKLRSWQASSDPDLAAAHDIVDGVQKSIVKLDACAVKLESKNFVPPKRSSGVYFEEKQLVSVLDKHRQKYKLAFEKVLKEDPHLLDELVVLKIISSTGEVVVQRGQRTPFIVRKSHIVGKNHVAQK
jgi:hypothetical protein